MVNNTNATVTVNSVAVHVDTCTLTGWLSATLAPGDQLIVTQVASGAAGGCPLSGPTGPHPWTHRISDRVAALLQGIAPRTASSPQWM